MPKLTREQEFLAKTMGVNLPFINNFTRKEKQLLAKMLLDGRNPSGIDQLALEWLKHVDGIEVFPKLPVHLRKEVDERAARGRMRYTTQRNAAMRKQLDGLNDRLT
jgi:hypothetical protein